MYMLAGTSFTGPSGKTYSASGQVDSPDVAAALKNGWSESDPGTPNELAGTLPTGSTNDYFPPGFSTAAKRLEITANSAGSTLTGLQAGAPDQRIMLVNLGTGALTLSHQSSSSAAAHRFLASADATVAANGGAVLLQYSETQQRWIVR